MIEFLILLLLLAVIWTSGLNIAYLLVLIVIFLIYFLIINGVSFFLRKHRMKNLAKELGVQFYSTLTYPNLKLTGILTETPPFVIRNIVLDTLQGKEIVVFDRISWTWLMPPGLTGFDDPVFTSTIINGRIYKRDMRKARAYFLFQYPNIYLPIEEIKKILHNEKSDLAIDSGPMTDKDIQTVINSAAEAKSYIQKLKELGGGLKE